MGRAPCCEKVGLKRGPWTPEEDRVLVAYIERYGHENWRALPKLAGLLRCGKSCRLRWINYLKPDIKRGNFTVEEEDTIIQLHEMLGNRWSAIAARLPGRTDNEIKNVWHTHLKKRKSTRPNVDDHVDQSCSDVSTSSSSGTSSSDVAGACREEEEGMDSWMEFPDIDESFWTEALMPLDVDPPTPTIRGQCGTIRNSVPDILPSTSCSVEAAAAVDDDMSFWLRVFMEAGVMQDLPEII